MYKGYGLRLIALFQRTRGPDALKQGDEKAPFRRWLSAVTSLTALSER